MTTTSPDPAASGSITLTPPMVSGLRLLLEGTYGGPKPPQPPQPLPDEIGLRLALTQIADPGSTGGARTRLDFYVTAGTEAARRLESRLAAALDALRAARAGDGVSVSVDLQDLNLG